MNHVFLESIGFKWIALIDVLEFLHLVGVQMIQDSVIAFILDVLRLLSVSLMCI